MSVIKGNFYAGLMGKSGEMSVSPCPVKRGSAIGREKLHGLIWEFIREMDTVLRGFRYSEVSVRKVFLYISQKTCLLRCFN